MRAKAFFLFLPCLIISGTGSAQTAEGAETSPAEIIVEGRRDSSEPDVTNAEPKVFVGSRLKRNSLQRSPYIASATTLGGLHADSGLDASKGTRTRRWKTCKATGAQISKATACALVSVDKAVDAGDLRQAQQLALALAESPQLPLEDRFVTQSYLYRIAEAIPDREAKREALKELVESGLLSEADERSAVRTLASMAYGAGDKEEALELYQLLGELDPESTQARVNAAALLQGFGRDEEARLQLREAIDIAQRLGRQVPKSWLENVQ